MKKVIFTLIAVSLLVAQCGKDYNGITPESTQKGAISLSLSSSGVFTIPLYATKSGENIATKAEVNVADFKVAIKKNGVTVKSYAKFSDVPSSIEIDPGAYTLEAGSAADEEAAFDQPIYFGSKDFTVEVGKVEPVSVVCKLSNVKVSVSCTDAFYREINDDFVIIVRNEKAFLEFDKAKIQSGVSAYFKVSKLTLQVQGTRKLDNSEVSHTITVDNVAAMDHHVFKFDVQETGSAEIGDMGISIDYSVNNKNHEIIIPGEDDTEITDPGDGGGGGGETNEYLPTISGVGISSPLTIKDADASTTPVNITVTCQNGKTINNLKVKIDSPDITAELMQGMGLDLEFDLANPSTAGAEALNTLNLVPTGTQIKGKTTYTFSVGGFMALLSHNTHKFTVTVTDSDNKSANATLTVIRVE